MNIDWVAIGNPGNAADTASNCISNAPDCGSVPYAYYISKYEVTNGQYAAFLNAVDSTGVNALALYNPNMGSDSSFGGINFVPGNAAGAKYVVKTTGGYADTGFANKPVTYTSFTGALRFANWLNNGQGSGSTETGAYTITLDGIKDNTVTRNPGAITFLTSENEWYKAAYYDAVSMSYFDYPTGSDLETACAAPGATANTANCFSAVGTVTDVGSYTGSASPYGTFDQGGNLSEWNEQISGIQADLRGLRGGHWAAGAISFAAFNASQGKPSDLAGGGPFVGFRVASLVPEPGSGLLVMTGMLGLAVWRRRRA